MPPRMLIVAGLLLATNPGSGKSTVFPVAGFGVEYFNADDRAAALNHGSYLRIPQTIRRQVNGMFEAFVVDCIERRISFALETTLRSAVTFEQAAMAKRAGFETEMRYLALDDFAQHLERVKIRADNGGHSAPEPVLRAIYEASLRNLPRAIREMDSISVYDNGRFDTSVRVLLEAAGGNIVHLAERVPAWMLRTLRDL